VKSIYLIMAAAVILTATDACTHAPQGPATRPSSTAPTSSSTSPSLPRFPLIGGGQVLVLQVSGSGKNTYPIAPMKAGVVQVQAACAGPGTYTWSLTSGTELLWESSPESCAHPGIHSVTMKLPAEPGGLQLKAQSTDTSDFAFLVTRK